MRFERQELLQFKFTVSHRSGCIEQRKQGYSSRRPCQAVQISHNPARYLKHGKSLAVNESWPTTTAPTTSACELAAMRIINYFLHLSRASGDADIDSDATQDESRIAFPVSAT